MLAGPWSGAAVGAGDSHLCNGHRWAPQLASSPHIAVQRCLTCNFDELLHDYNLYCPAGRQAKQDPQPNSKQWLPAAVAEILKARGFAREESIRTALGVFGDEHRWGHALLP